jgi:hypothetical protein
MQFAPKLIGRYWVHDTHPHLEGKFTLRYGYDLDEA